MAPSWKYPIATFNDLLFGLVHQTAETLACYNFQHSEGLMMVEVTRMKNLALRRAKKMNTEVGSGLIIMVMILLKM